MPAARQAHGELGERAHLAVDLDRTAVLLRDDVVADRQAEPSALTGRLGREERLEQFVPDLGRNAGPVVNLFGNGFYATSKRCNKAIEPNFKPSLKVTTRDLGEAVEIRVRDNGIGIAPENRDKLFQPFFTTKPTGEGTGLGLSISYDIITQQHGGTIEVDSMFGEFTQFTIRLPRSRRVQPQG